jgi:hypothetical protein
MAGQTFRVANGFGDASEQSAQLLAAAIFDPMLLSVRLPIWSEGPYHPAAQSTSAINGSDEPQHHAKRAETALDLAIDRLVQSLAAANIRQLPNDRATDAVFENADDRADILLPDLNI